MCTRRKLLGRLFPASINLFAGIFYVEELISITKQLTFIDFFAGVGMFRLGMEMAGHKCVGFCEKDKYALKSYRAIHDTKGEWYKDDIREVDPDELPHADVYIGGFPCQSFSNAGKKLGFADERGTLFFELARLAKERQPAYMVLENVKGLLHKPNRENFAAILSCLDDIGYDVEWQVCNSKDFGVPQSRERVFIVCHLRNRSTRKVFPITGKDGKTTRQIIPGPQGNRVYDVNGSSCTLTGTAGGMGGKTGLYLTDDVRACFYPEKKSVYQNGKRFKEIGQPMYTLTTADRHGIILKNKRIRKLSPRECWRLQGMPDDAYDKAVEAGVSETQLYRLAGNGVSVPVVFTIGNNLEILEEYK